MEWNHPPATLTLALTLTLEWNHPPANLIIYITLVAAYLQDMVYGTPAEYSEEHQGATRKSHYGLSLEINLGLSHSCGHSITLSHDILICTYTHR